jgi:diguanylate cyclase (GGDEF)-like protein
MVAEQEKSGLVGSLTSKILGGKESEADAVREELGNEIKNLKEKDPVTGLCSKKHFWQIFKERIEKENQGTHTQFSLLIFDLSRFHIINETMGYQAGDDLLQAVGKRLEEALPNENNRLISRIYGNTYAIVLWNTQPSEAIAIAKRIIDALLPPFRMTDNHVHVTSCVGISHYPENAKDGNTLMFQAEKALQEAKIEGENTYNVFSSDMEIDGVDRLQLENYLHQALDRNEFKLVFQPQMAIAERRVASVEALIRWESVDLNSVVSPAKFIPILQETGLIIPVGQWILRQSLTECKNWVAKYPWMKVAVNINGNQLKHKDFVKSYVDVIKEVGIEPKHLILDLQESALSHDAESTLAKLKELHDMGVTLAIDDFGVGMTSFHQLKKMPVDVMKIDPSFLKDIESDPEHNEPMVDALISMAQSLDLTVVGEGIESEYQMSFLRKHGCHHMMGYFFCKPLPANEVTAFLDKFNPQQ